MTWVGSFGDPLLEPLKNVAVGKCGQGSFNHREGVARTLGKINLQYHLNTILLQEPNILIIQVWCDTVDGRHPAPVDMVNIPLFAGLYTSQVVFLAGFLNHQPYDHGTKQHNHSLRLRAQDALGEVENPHDVGRFFRKSHS